MSAPPRLAVWLVSHLASRYSRESLIGDLLEEYSRGRSRRWYWQQVAIAIGLAAANALTAARWLLISLVLLRAMAAVLSLTALVSFVRHSQYGAICSLGVPPVLLVSLGALCLVVSMLMSQRRHARRPRLRRGLLLLSVTIALGTATLTWAGTTAPVSPMSSAAMCRSVQ